MKPARHPPLRACTPALLAASLAALLALAPSSPADAQTAPVLVPRDVIGPIVVRCLRPYSYSGPAYIRAGYSGDANNFHFNGSGYLRVESLRAYLFQPGLVGADLGSWTDNVFAWTRLPLVNGAVTYDPRRDGPLYLNSPGFAKLVLYRASGTSGTTASGWMEVKGCLVNAVPRALKLPLDMDDTPLPPPRRID